MGYRISVNGEQVWESEGEAMLVDQVKMNNARGEITVVGSHNGDEYLDITVNVRSWEAPDTYLDMIEEKKMQERRAQFEPAPDTSREGYVAADPETGQPVGDPVRATPENEDLSTVPTTETEPTVPTSENLPAETAPGEVSF